jgi:glycosyltransferase involved in cell wall biosynthesis
MKPKIHLYTICWNEEVILPHFLKHYTGLCESIVVYDNYSTDKSVQICAKYANVSVRKYDTNGEIRDDIYLQIKNNCWKESRNSADWVIVCDTDEFIYHADLINVLKQAKNQGISHFRSVGYEMVGDRMPREDDHIFELIKDGFPNEACNKTALFDPDLIEEINYEWGGHTCLPIGRLKEDRETISLLHYKYFSLDYLIERYRVLGRRLSEKNIKYKLGKHYLFSPRKIKKLYEGFRKKATRVIDN